MITRSGQQRGEGRLGLVIAIVVCATIGYVLWKVVPLRIANSDFGEYVENQLRMYSVNEEKETDLVEHILAEAKKQGIPIVEGDIHIDEGERKVMAKIHYRIVQPIIGGKEWIHDYDIEREVPKIN